MEAYFWDIKGSTSPGAHAKVKKVHIKACIWKPLSLSYWCKEDFFFFFVAWRLLLWALGIRMAQIWSDAAIEWRANELTNLLRLIVGCKRKMSNPFELFTDFFNVVCFMGLFLSAVWCLCVAILEKCLTNGFRKFLSKATLFFFFFNQLCVFGFCSTSPRPLFCFFGSFCSCLFSVIATFFCLAALLYYIF